MRSLISHSSIYQKAFSYQNDVFRINLLFICLLISILQYNYIDRVIKLKALINIANFQKAYDIIAGSKYYYEIMNNINSYIRTIRDEADLKIMLNSYPYIKNHGVMVSNLATRIATGLNLEKNQIQTVTIASLYHDISQIFFPLKIQTSFNMYEDSQVQALTAHTIISAEVIGALFESRDIYTTILLHHEYLNGSGFPFGLKEEQIPIEANILRLADYYISLATESYFFPAEKKEDIIIDIYNNINTLFDERIVIEFLREVRKELKNEETHFIDLDKKLNEWRDNKANKAMKLKKVSNHSKKRDYGKPIDLVKSLREQSAYQQKSII